jgi:hypothetical protein
MLKLSGKTRDEVAGALAGFDREQLITLVHSLVTLDRLYTAKQIAEAEGCNKRDVLADMKAGRFIDPIFGAGFFVRARNSFRVTGSAVRAWRRSSFVRARDAIPAGKNALEDPQNGVEAKEPGQRRDLANVGADLVGKAVS